MKKLEFSNILMLFSFLLSTILAFSFSSFATWTVWVSTILGILASKTAKDGKWYTFLFDITSYVFYLQICLKEKFLGEFILSILIIIFNLFCIKEWKSNSNNNILKINKVGKSETKFICFVGIMLLIIYTLLLHKINSNLAMLNAICTISFILGNYFCYRRSVVQFYCLIIYEIAFILIWAISATNGEVSSYLFLIGGTCELIYDILAIIKWKKMTTIQKSIKCKTMFLMK